MNNQNPSPKQSPQPVAEEKATPEAPTPDPLQELTQKLKEQQDLYLRTYADFENFRKRTSKEKEDLALNVTERVLREVLEVKDNLELALLHAEKATDIKVLKDGVSLTLKQMSQLFDKFNVKEVNVEGQAFNPAFHEAISQEENPAKKAGDVARVFQKGYLFQDRLLRPARVSVVR